MRLEKNGVRKTVDDFHYKILDTFLFLYVHTYILENFKYSILPDYYS